MDVRDGQLSRVWSENPALAIIEPTYEDDRTYVKDVKNPHEVRPPGHNLFVALRVEMPGNHAPSPSLGDPPLDLLHSPEARPET